MNQRAIILGFIAGSFFVSGSIMFAFSMIGGPFTNSFGVVATLVAWSAAVITMIRALRMPFGPTPFAAPAAPFAEPRRPNG